MRGEFNSASNLRVYMGTVLEPQKYNNQTVSVVGFDATKGWYTDYLFPIYLESIIIERSLLLTRLISEFPKKSTVARKRTKTYNWGLGNS